MNYLNYLLAITMVAGTAIAGFAQQGPIQPSVTGTGVYHGLTPPLRDLPKITDEEYQLMVEKAEKKLLNKKLEHRSYPYAGTALPKGPDPAWQRTMGTTDNIRDIVLSFDGQTSPFFPPDPDGTAGPLYYFQVTNLVYAIYDKTDGALIAGPTPMNQLFSGVSGSSCNDGDPLVLYDEQADRWLAAELSVCGSNYMLVAVSQTNDPTGSWHVYSFNMAGFPDYEKFGIWQDGYYMATNTPSGNDIYVFERDQMLTGGTAQMVAFNNPWRPTTIDGFHMVPPLDNDGASAPAGAPGLFITINDDAIGGGDDQLWIYELDVDWTTPSNSTWDRVQQVDVDAFDSNFGNSWNNITQPGTNQKLDAIPMIIMNRPQYRNFGSYETMVCCHTVDVDATNHAGIRWYELRRSGGGDWTVRQSGTYAPDEHSRWMGSVALNGSNEIGLAYTVSSSTEYPGIRYTGQSAAEYAAGSGIMNITETVVQSGISSQTSGNRFGDYANLAIDPDDDHTFWFTGEYIGSNKSRKSKIVAFELSAFGLSALFSASSTSVCEDDSVTFTDLSNGSPSYWEWTFEGGSPDTSYLSSPVIAYDFNGTYDVKLVVSDGLGFDTLLIIDYITVNDVPAQPATPSGDTLLCSGGEAAEYSTNSVPGALFFNWSVFPPEAGTFSGSGMMTLFIPDESFTGGLEIMAEAVGLCGNSTPSVGLPVTMQAGPTPYNLTGGGGLCEGGAGIEVGLDNSDTDTDYELFLDNVTTGLIEPGTGSSISFGLQADTGYYTCTAFDSACYNEMLGLARIYYVDSVGVTATPSGPAMECNNHTAVEYTTTGAPNAELYIWSIIPQNSGNITGTTTTATVDWNPGFNGTALMTVHGYNDCGAGPSSEFLEVTVNSAPVPDITGLAEVCSTAAGVLYTTPAATGNSYQWEITGGEITSGTATSEILVTWGIPGTGSLSIIEESTEGCSDTAFLEVTIFDCTGLGEEGQGKIELFPNPVEDRLTLKSNHQGGGIYTVRIVSLTGQLVYNHREDAGKGTLNMTISTTDLPAGVYSVHVTSADGKLMESKFMKIR